MNRMSRVVIGVFAVLTCIILTTAAAQAAGNSAVPPGTVAPQMPLITGTQSSGTTPPASDTYGLSGWTVVNIPSWQLQTYNYGLGFIIYTDGTIGPQAGDTYRYFESAVHIPTGALVEGVTYFDYDDSASNDIGMWLWMFTMDATAGGTSTSLWTHSSSGTPGYEGAYEAISPAITWTNWEADTDRADYYEFFVHLGATGNRFGGLTLWYQRQVSPAPATATFNDVPTGYWAFPFIEALASSGITAGCGGGNYCPEAPITRAEMAVFLSGALGLYHPDLEQ